MKWDWIFFDADETLFTFDSFSGLQRMFLDYSVTFTAEDFQDYQAVNKPLWVDYQNGAITSLQLQHQRFDSWAERLNVPPGELNDAFMNAMAEICAPLPGAVSLLNALQGKVRMGIITNGFTSLQQLPLAGAQVSTPAFDELQTSAPARRALWQQICAHEHDFYPQHG